LYYDVVHLQALKSQNHREVGTENDGSLER
jgi:hypothetical protein